MALRPLEKDVSLNKCKKWEIEVYQGRDAEGKKTRDWVIFEGSHKQAQLEDSRLKLEAKKLRNAKKRTKEAGQMIFGEYFNYWLKEITPKIEKSTLRTYVKHVKMLTACVGDLILSDDTQCRQLQDRLSGDEKLQGCKPKTIKNTIGTLRDAIHYAMRWDMLTRDIGAGLITPKVPKNRYYTFTRGEIENQLLPAAKKYKHGLFIRLLASCGLRCEEAAALSWRDVDFKKGTIRIAQAADIRLREVKESGETKEKASIRHIDLDKETLNMLTDHKVNQSNVVNIHNLVFPADDGRVLGQWTIERTLKCACKSAGLPYISPHKLRHGVAQIMDTEGFSATQIAEMLGHADGTVSEQLYTLSQRHGKSVLK